MILPFVTVGVYITIAFSLEYGNSILLIEIKKHVQDINTNCCKTLYAESGNSVRHSQQLTMPIFGPFLWLLFRPSPSMKKLGWRFSIDAAYLT